MICKSEGHWARDCPQNFKNKNKEYNKVVHSSTEKDEEKVFIGDISVVDEESWSDVDAILDTGCKSTVCGEL